MKTPPKVQRRLCALTSIATVLGTLLPAVLLPAALCAADGPGRPIQFRGDPAHSGVYDTTGLDGYGGMLWRAELPGPVRSAAAVADRHLFVGSAGGFLHALDRWTGREVWRYRAGAAVHGSPAVWHGTVYVTDAAGSLHAVDQRTGERLWVVETGPTLPWAWGHESGDLYLSSPLLGEAGDEMGLWFGAGDGFLRSVDPVGGTVLWELPTEGRIRSTPALSEGVVVVGSADGSVYAADASTGALRWRFDTAGRGIDSAEFGFDRKTVQSSPSLVDGRVFVGARNGSLYALDLETGEELWESSHGSSWVNGGPAVADGRVFVGSSDGRFIQAVDAESGEEIWRRDSTGVVWSSPVVVEKAVVFSESSGLVRAFHVATGETLWYTFLPVGTWASPVVHEGTLFIGSDDGFYALRGSEGRPFHRAVFWDSAYTEARWYLDHEWLAGELEDLRWDRLDAATLRAWLQQRVEDREPSALVMALDRLPDDVRQGGRESLFRRYLEAGGTVVWPGLLPGIWLRDLEDGATGGLAAVDWGRASELLGVDAGAAIFDHLGAVATSEGIALGLPERSLAHWTVDAQESLEPLAVDENGRYAAWRKGYGGPQGTGFVRVWSSRRGLRDLIPFVTAAEWRPVDPERDALPRHVVIARILDRFVREGMRRLGVPGLSISGVSRDGVLVERGWGVRDVERGGAVDPRTGFYIASSTKSFVGLLTALLDHRGWLDLDAPLTACLPGLDLEGTVDPSTITLRDLLRHTRGWENGMVSFRTAYTDFLDPEELRALLARTSTVEDDGYFAYDNVGYIVVDLCFREHLGVDWKELAETQILAPLGMVRTTPFVSEAAATGNLALPHVWDGARHRRIPTKADDLMHAAGGLVTTAEDAGRWLRLHLGEGRLDGRRVLPAEPVREVLTRQVEADAALWEFTREGYGLGWFDGHYRGERMVHHFGGYPGAQAHISLMPERGFGVAVFVNGGGGNAYLLPHLTAGLFYDLVLGRPAAERHAWEALARAEREGTEALEAQKESFARRDRLMARRPELVAARYVGVYRSPARGNLIVTRAEDGGLRIDWGDQEGPLVPDGEDAFLALWERRSPDRMTFDLPDEGPARSLSFGGFEVPRVSLGARGSGSEPQPGG